VKDPVADAFLRRLPRLALPITSVHAQALAGRFDTWDVMIDLCLAAIARAAWSRRQLLEVLVDLWSNQLNITCPSSQVWDSRARFDAEVIRRHALGRYQDMLRAAITHPAMITYLNNEGSTKHNPDENLGREVLELHSVGVRGGYTERDVKVSALILTGLSVDWRTGAYANHPEDHYVGPVRVMGFRHPTPRRTAARRSTPTYATWRHAPRHHPSGSPAGSRSGSSATTRPRPWSTGSARVYLARGTAIAPMLVQLFASQSSPPRRTPRCAPRTNRCWPVSGPSA